MPFYQRAFLYPFRKRAKTALLFLILLLVNSMILGTVMILHAAQTTQISIEKNQRQKQSVKSRRIGIGFPVRIFLP